MDNEPNVNNVQKPSKVRARSRAYPSMSLEESLVRVKKINDNLGMSGNFNRESIAVGMGYSSLNGASARSVAALVQYGLLSRNNSMYSLSDLAKKYIFPVNDNDVRDALVEASLNPILFKEIYDTFVGQVLPKQFVNRLVQEFGIQPKVSTEVEGLFKNAMSLSGILQSNGLLVENTGSSSLNSVSDNQSVSDTNPDSVDNGEVIRGFDNKYQEVKLPSGMIIKYPVSLSSAFAFGVFGDELRQLDTAVEQYLEGRDE